MWRHVSDALPHLIEVARNRIKSIKASTTSHPFHIKSFLMKSQRGRGLYYNQWIKETKRCSVSSAKNAIGETQTRPNVYIPLVRAAVSAPFSHPKPGPAVPAWSALTDSEISTGIPFWWKTFYSRSSKGIPDTVWSSLSSLSTPREFFDIITKAEGGKSGGHDNVTIDLLKVAVGAFPGSTTNGAFPGEDHRCLALLTSLVNTGITTGRAASSHKKGIIVLIPKPGENSTDAADMRPITLLPEIGKLLNRVLATRFTAIVHQSPYVLDDAQRAYLHDGNSKQCLHTIFDVCEDFNERFVRAHDAELILLSYDIRKAFDSVQRFSIVASCERLNLPKAFIDLLSDSLTDSSSRVRTHHGLSEEFDVLTSVRQGDPLAAIAFIILMDALHAGFKNNPLAPGDKLCGYSVKGSVTPVYSSGYADDTLVLASSWQEAQIQHLWLLDFFVAHHLRLNAKKSHVCIGSNSEISAGLIGPLLPNDRLRFLPDIDEELIHCPSAGAPAPGPLKEVLNHRCPDPSATQFWPDAVERLRVKLNSPSLFSKPSQQAIVTCGRTFAFRYLGYMLRLDLEPDEEINLIQKRVMEICVKIKTHSLDLLESSFCIRECLYPRLELGLIFARIPKSMLDGWDKLIRSYVLGVHQGLNTHSVAIEAFHAAIGILPLRAHTTMVKAVELGSCLRSKNPPCSETSWSRLRTAVRLRAVDTTDKSYDGENWTVATSFKDSRANRTSGILKALSSVGVYISWRANTGAHNLSAPDPPPLFQQARVDCRIDCPILRHEGPPSAQRPLCEPYIDPVRLIAFTDGSYMTQDRSGYASVLCREVDVTDNFDFHRDRCVVLSGGSPRAGRSYSAELSAVIATLFSVPANSTILIVSDSLSACQAIQRPLVCESLRLRLGCRAQLETVRHLIRVRSASGGQTNFAFTRAHTELDNVFSRGNNEADSEAKTAAQNSRFDTERDTPFLFKEEKAVFWKTPDSEHGSDLWHISGNLRGTIQRRLQLASLQSWKTRTKSQGKLARSYGSLLLGHLDLVRKARDGSLLLFVLLLITEQLPTADRLIFPVDSRTNENMLCSRCNLSTQSNRHVFRCRAVRPLIRALCTTVRRDLEFLVLPMLRTSGLNEHQRQTLTQTPRLLNWFDASNDFPSGLQGAENIDGFDRIAGVSGIIPPGLADLLCLNPDRCGIRECHRSRFKKTIDESLKALSMTILRRALEIFECWYSRPFGVVPRNTASSKTSVDHACPPDHEWPQGMDLLGQSVNTHEIDGSNGSATVISIGGDGDPTLDYGKAGLFALPASCVTPKRLKRESLEVSPAGTLHNPRIGSTVAVLSEDGSAFLAKVTGKFPGNELNLLYRAETFSVHASRVRIVKHKRAGRPLIIPRALQEGGIVGTLSTPREPRIIPSEADWPQNLDLLGLTVTTRELDESKHSAVVITVNKDNTLTLDYGSPGLFSLAADRVVPKRNHDASTLSPAGILQSPCTGDTVVVLGEDGSAYLAKVDSTHPGNELNLVHRAELFSAHASRVRIVKRNRPGRPPKRPRQIQEGVIADVRLPKRPRQIQEGAIADVRDALPEIPSEADWPKNLDLLGLTVLTRELDESRHSAIVVTVNGGNDITLDYGKPGLFSLDADRVVPKRKRDASTLSPAGILQSPRKGATVAVLNEDGSAYLAKVDSIHPDNELNLVYRGELFSAHASRIRIRTVRHKL